MKKYLLSIACVVVLAFTTETAKAQYFDYGYFNHVSVGVSAGFPGLVGIEVATPVGDYLQLRGGIDLISDIKVKADMNTSTLDMEDVAVNLPDKVGVKGEINTGNTKLMLDIYPFKSAGFHFTVGAYFGKEKFVNIYTDASSDATIKQCMDQGVDMGVKLGDYLLTPDANGHIDASIRTKAVKPYVGIGFGRAVPKKRLAFSTDLGVQFWGKPSVYCNDEVLTDEKIGSDSGGVMKTISTISVCPVISFRLIGRIL